MTRKPNSRRIAELHATRGDNTFIHNFLVNLARVATNIRTVTGGRPGTASKETKRQFTIGLVSCLETFFRDMFVYCLDRNPGLLQLYLKDSDWQENTTQQTLRQEKGSVSQRLADTMNFQSLDTVDYAFRHFFSGAGSLHERLAALERIVSIPARAAKGPAKLRLPEDWRTTLDRLLRLRHQLVHDANFDPAIAPSDLRMFEAYVLWIAQFFNFVIVEIITHHRIIVDSDGFPVMFLVEDLIAEDWYVVGHRLEPTPSPQGNEVR